MPADTPIFLTRASGKLLLSGEYAVLDGALALAVPTRFGQTLTAWADETDRRLLWKAIDADSRPWLEAEFDLPGIQTLRASDPAVAARLRDVLLACQAQNPAFLRDSPGFRVETRLDFPRNWGLGTSSTLIGALGRWAGVDAYRVLADTLGGSGYDLACAYAEGPVLYQLDKARPMVRPVAFRPSFADRLFFVFLGEKQDSREGIRRYRAKMPADTAALAQRLGALTTEMVAADSLPPFEAALREHEALLSQALDLPRVKDRLFPDFWGEVKSLGAWGGDFVLATSERSAEETRSYFVGKGLDVFFPYREIVAH